GCKGRTASDPANSAEVGGDQVIELLRIVTSGLGRAVASEQASEFAFGRVPGRAHEHAARVRTHRMHEALGYTSARRAHQLQPSSHMTEQQNRRLRRTRDEQIPNTTTGAEDTRARKALDERWEAVRRWISVDEDGCCRGID